MEKLLEKISSYNLLNNLLPGAVFCYLLNSATGINLISQDLVGNLFLFYFYGMMVSRIGSIVIGPFFRKFKIVTFSDYGDFVKASGIDPKIDVLSETNNTYRTFIALFLMIGIVKIYVGLANVFSWLNTIASVVVLIGLILLFSFSYRKQVGYIRKRVIHVCNTIDSVI